jgi:hypothetical protein
MKIKCLIIAALLVQSVFVFAGLEWTTKTTSSVDGKEKSVTTLQGDAQNGNVREEVIDIKGKDSSGFKKGSYFLYKGDSNNVTIVDTEKKSYMELPLDNMMGAVGQVMDIKVSNVKTTSTKLPDEVVNSYPCSHVRIDSSYDMETKIAFITSNTHIEQSQEIWGTDKISAKEFAAVYKNKAFRTSIKELDQMIEKQASAYKGMNFVLKMVMTQKNTDASNPKSAQNVITQMIVDKVEQKQLNDDMFMVPAGYKRTEAAAPKKDEAKKDNTEKEEKPRDLKPEDVLKGLFGN